MFKLSFLWALGSAVIVTRLCCTEEFGSEKHSHCKIWGAAAGHPAHDRLHIEVTESVSDTWNGLIGSGLKRSINLQTKNKAVHQRCKGLNLQQCAWRILDSVHMSDSRHTEPDLQWCMDPKLFFIKLRVTHLYYQNVVIPASWMWILFGFFILPTVRRLSLLWTEW